MFSGFMLFNFMNSLGPSSQTYLLAGEVFPTAIRGKGLGFAAAVGKIGAVATAFLFPILLDAIGTRRLLYGLIAASILGAAVTWLFRIEGQVEGHSGEMVRLTFAGKRRVRGPRTFRAVFAPAVRR